MEKVERKGRTDGGERIINGRKDGAKNVQEMKEEERVEVMVFGDRT